MKVDKVVVGMMFVAMSVFVGSITYALLHPPAVNTHVEQDELIKFDSDYVHVMRDEKRGNTCYVLKASISCVKTEEKR